MFETIFYSALIGFVAGFILGGNYASKRMQKLYDDARKAEQHYHDMWQAARAEAERAKRGFRKVRK